MRAANSLAAALVSVLAFGCTPSPTTAMLQIGAVPGLHLASLSADVLVDGEAKILGQQLSSQNGLVDLPGTMVIWLPDVQADVAVLLVGSTTDGGAVHATVAFHSMPHQQVLQIVTLGSSQPGGNDPLGGDLGPANAPEDAGVAAMPMPDLSVAAAPDAASPPAPDLAPPPVVTLARDDFQRPNQTFWGKASDGQLWGADANTANTFSIVNHTGQITDSSNSNDTGVLGPVATNAEVLVTASMNTFSSASEVGPTLRFTDNSNFYKAIINGSIIKIVLKVKGNSTDLVTASFAASAGTLYSIRFRASGSTLSAKAWPAASAEPSGWTVSVTDTTFTSGYCGVRLVFNANATATFTSFAAFPL